MKTKTIFIPLIRLKLVQLMLPILLLNLFSFAANKKEALCTILSPTPLGEKKYTPQGMTWVDSTLLFANTWKNKKSRVYHLETDSLSILSYFDMPKEAVHTSGLCIIDGFLWGVDYKSNRAYKIDYKQSFADKKCALVGSFDTGLKGTSACCAVHYKGQSLLAISDFMRTRKVIFVDPEKCLKAGSTGNNVLYFYKNQGFSQGLEWDGTYLYESENKLPRAIINKIDLEKVCATHKVKDGLIQQYTLPVKGIEDLAFDGEKFWSSDEILFKFLTITLP